MTNARFVAVRFQSNSMRRYTYRDENTPPLAVGDKGDVETDKGIVTVEVVAVELPEPAFATRPIKRFEPVAGGAVVEPPKPPSPPAEVAPREPRKAAAAKKAATTEATKAETE